MDMQVQKKYRAGGGWHNITLEDAIAQTEILGFYDCGTVEQLLTRGEEIRTPYAVFRNADVKQRRRYIPNGCKSYVRRFG